MKKTLLTGSIVLALVLFGSKNMKNEDIKKGTGFVEIVAQSHLISNGFDENHKEVIEEVVVDQPAKKFLSVNRIQSISEKYILTTYGFVGFP